MVIWVKQIGIAQKCLKPANVANATLALEQEKNKLARNIAYFVIALIMPIDALVR